MRRRWRTALSWLALSCALAAGWPAAAGGAKVAKTALDAPGPISEVTDRLAEWVRASGDNAGLPFIIVDKRAAQVFVFSDTGLPLGAAPALLGSARGDNSTPGIGDRELSDIAPEERTTPAGRFLAAYGPSADGERVFWVDYETAISLHPVVTSNPKERRVARLRSPTIDDNRITFGCINVARSFYDQVVRKTFSGTRGVVYILPEERSLAETFPRFYLASLGEPATGRPLAVNAGLSTKRLGPTP